MCFGRIRPGPQPGPWSQPRRCERLGPPVLGRQNRRQNLLSACRRDKGGAYRSSHKLVCLLVLNRAGTIYARRA